MKQIITSSLIKKNLVPGNSTVLAEMVFNDLLRLLNFIHKASKDGVLVEDFIFNSQIEYLDEIWHQFILHTKLYYSYCNEQFGELIHHTPGTDQTPAFSESGQVESFAFKCKRQMNILIHYEDKEFVDRIFFQYPIIFKNKA